MRLHSVFIIALLSISTAFANTPQIYGHRGAAGLSPENTLPAYRTALRLGVHVVDMDVTLTKDEIVVVSHAPYLDPAFTRGPDGKWLNDKQIFIKDLTYEELQKYNVGQLNPNDPYARLYPFQHPEEKATIPKLEDVIRLSEKLSRRRVNYQIELKTNPLQPQWSVEPDALAAKVYEVIKSQGVVDRTEIQSFDWRSLYAMQSIAPQVKTSYITDEGWYAQQKNLFEERSEAWHLGYDLESLGKESIPALIAQLGGKVWSPNFYDLTPEALKKAKQLGLKVVVWTVDSPDIMTKMLDAGVDGIITNRPDLLRGLFIARNLNVASGIDNTLTTKLATNQTTTPSSSQNAVSNPPKTKRQLRKQRRAKAAAASRNRRYFRVRR